MKTKTFIIACLATLGLMAAGCQKELSPAPATSYTLNYSVDGETTTVTVCGDAEMTNLLRQLNTFARQGHLVTVAQSGAEGAAGQAKDVITFSTTSESEMLAWEAARLKEKCQVTITFDSQTGTYTGTAVPHQVDVAPVKPTSLVGTEWVEHFNYQNTILGTYYDIQSDDMMMFETDSTGSRYSHYYPTSTNPYEYDSEIYPFTYTYDSILGRCEWYNIPGNNYFVMDYNIDLDAFIVVNQYNDTAIYYRVK